MRSHPPLVRNQSACPVYGQKVQPLESSAAAAKEVGVGNPAEETTAARLKKISTAVAVVSTSLRLLRRCHGKGCRGVVPRQLYATGIIRPRVWCPLADGTG
jgi:hypothetical protein